MIFSVVQGLAASVSKFSKVFFIGTMLNIGSLCIVGILIYNTLQLLLNFKSDTITISST